MRLITWIWSFATRAIRRLQRQKSSENTMSISDTESCAARQMYLDWLSQQGLHGFVQIEVFGEPITMEELTALVSEEHKVDLMPLITEKPTIH